MLIRSLNTHRVRQKGASKKRPVKGGSRKVVRLPAAPAR